MRRPGARLRAVAAQLCHPRTMERYIDPAVADLQAEYADAVRRGRRWEPTWVWIVGHIAVVQVMALWGLLSVVETLCHLESDDRHVVRRAVAAGSATMIVATMVLAIIPFVTRFRDHPRSVELVVYLVPAALPLSIPVGVTVGILWGLGGMSASRRARTAMLSLAVGASLVSFSMVAWVAPASNQAFRVSMAGRPVLKGLNELTIDEIHQRLASGTQQSPSSALRSTPRSLTSNYYQRLALGIAPLVLAVVAIAFARRRAGRVMPLLFGAGVGLVYYTIVESARRL